MNEELLALLERIAELTDEELADLDAQLVAEFDRLDGEPRSADTVTAMGQVAEATSRVREEQTTRSAAVEAAEAKAAELRAQMHPVDETPAEPETPSGDEPPAEPETPAEPEAPAAEPEAVAAAARPPARTLPRQPTPAELAAANARAPKPRTAQPGNGGDSLVASARMISQKATVGMAVGEDITDRDRLDKMFSETLERIKNTRGSDEPIILASIKLDYPESRKLGDDPYENERKIRAVVSEQALVASGGICGPVNVDYSLLVLSVADRPVKEAFPGFNATRGGLRFMKPPTFTSVGTTATASVWPEATDASPGNATKPVFTVVCGDEDVVYVDAVPTRLKFGNMQGRFFPELVSANTDLAMSYQARVADLNLLSKVQANSTSVSSTQLLGATRDILATVDQAAAAYRYRSRLGKNYPLAAIFPFWALPMFQADLVREQAHDNAGSISVFAVTEADVVAWFKARNVNLTFSLDGQPLTTSGGSQVAYPGQTFASQAVGLLNEWPTSIVWYLFAEGTFQYLDGGEINLGIVRDSVLDSTNDYETFIEPLEGLAFRGFESLQIVSPVRPNGESAVPVSTSGY